MAVKNTPRNCYAALEVDRNATDEEIRAAFKRQAKIWHPDKNAAPNAADKFRIIREAYEVLSNTQRRKTHDLTLPPGSTAKWGSGAAAQQQNSAPKRAAQTPVSAAKANAASAGGQATSKTSAATPQPKTTIASFISILVAGAAGVPPAEMRSMASQVGVDWPKSCTERNELIRELRKFAQTALDSRVRLGLWSQLAVKDIALWLEIQGCSLKATLGTDTVTKEQLVRLVRNMLWAQGSSTAEGGEKSRSPARSNPSNCRGRSRSPAMPSSAQGKTATKGEKVGPRARGRPVATPFGPRGEFGQKIDVGAPLSMAFSCFMAAGAAAMPANPRNRGKSEAVATGVGRVKQGMSRKGRLSISASRNMAGRRSLAAGKSSKAKTVRKSLGTATRRPAANTVKVQSTSLGAAARRRVSLLSKANAPKVVEFTDFVAAQQKRTWGRGMLASSEPSAKRARAESPEVESVSSSAAAPASFMPTSGAAFPCRAERSGSCSSSSSESSSSTVRVVGSVHAEFGRHVPAAAPGEGAALPATHKFEDAHRSRKADPNIIRKLEDLRGLLELHRERGDGRDQRILPVLTEIDVMDSRGEVHARELKESRIGVELNKAWWRKNCHGAVALRAAGLILTWMTRHCKKMPSPSPSPCPSPTPAQ